MCSLSQSRAYPPQSSSRIERKPSGEKKPNSFFFSARTRIKSSSPVLLLRESSPSDGGSRGRTFRNSRTSTRKGGLPACIKKPEEREKVRSPFPSSAYEVVSSIVVSAELVIDEHDPLLLLPAGVLVQEDVAALDVVVAEHHRRASLGEEVPAKQIIQLISIQKRFA